MRTPPGRGDRREARQGGGILTPIPPDGSAAGPGAAFTDARGCREWLATLPLTNIAEAQALVLEALRSLNAAAETGAIERLKCLELMREKIAFLQGEQRERYVGKTLPLLPGDFSAWASGLAMLAAMEDGYRLLIAASAAGEIEGHRALVAQRALRYVGAQMQFHAAIYRRFDESLWSRAHGLYSQAEAEAIETQSVRDSLEGEAGSSSVAEAWIHVVLAQAALPAELAAAEMDFVDALLGRWSRKVRILREPPERAEGAHAQPLAIDLARPQGAGPVLRGEAGGTERFLDLEELSRSIRRRIRALANEEDPASLGLPAQVGGPEALRQLQRVHRLWCEGAPPRSAAKVPRETAAGLVFGPGEIHFFLTGGKAFEQPDRKRELSSREQNDIAMFGRVTERTQSAMKVEHDYGVERWGVVDESVGAWRLLRPASAAKGVAIGRLAAMRLGDGAPFFLGVVSAIAQEADERLTITLTLFPGRPEPIAVRAADARNRASALWSQAFRLPALAKLKIPESLVVPGGIAARGRGIDLWAGGAKESTVDEILEHGSDFDRITTF